MKRSKSISILALATVLTCTHVRADVPADLQELAKNLHDPAASQQLRDESAKRLLSQQTSEANAILRDTLVDVKDRPAQLAVARALAWRAPAQEQFIVPLLALLGDDRSLTDAAATALARSDNTRDVLPLFVAFINEPKYPEASRVAVVRAMASMTDKSVAQALIDIVTSRQEPPAFRAAAADSLAGLTGITSNGQDAQSWVTWWDLQKNVSDSDFRHMLLTQRSAKLEQLQQQRSTLTDEIQSLLIEQYQSLNDQQKSDRLLKYLVDPLPELRAIGAKIIYNSAVENRPIPPEAGKLLRKMIADSSPDVREQVARSLQQINDSASTSDLLNQLQHEDDADVRCALVAALGNMQELRAVPTLVKLLDDPSYHVQEAAAQALGAIAPALRDKDAAAAHKLADQLRQVTDARADTFIGEYVRPAFVAAMVPLHDNELLPTFYRLCAKSESLPIRRAAIQGLGELARDDVAEKLLDLAQDAEPGIRLDALIALGKIKTDKYAGIFIDHLDPAKEHDETNRSKAWDILSTAIVPLASSDNLAQWANLFANQPERQLVILTQLEKNRASENDPAALARVRQTLGELLLHQLSRPADAITYLKQSLAYLRSRPEPADPKTMQGLITDALDAMLQSRQYTDAADFASQVLAESPDNQQVISPRIWQEVVRLRRTGDVAAAQALIDESIKITPPLASRYRTMLQNVGNELRARASARPIQPTTTD